MMAPVAKMVYAMGIRLLRYLDNWLIFAESRQKCLWTLDQVLQLSTTGDCSESREVFSDSFPESHVSGDDTGFEEFHGFSNPEESGEVQKDSVRVFVLREAASKIGKYSLNIGQLI